jgi:ribose transport system permease protein
MRYEMHEWPTDSLEARGNGRIICYDPEERQDDDGPAAICVFPNGIVMASDGQSLLFAESWACRISRYWFDGPRKGQVERVIEDLPGYPDNHQPRLRRQLLAGDHAAFAARSSTSP